MSFGMGSPSAGVRGPTGAMGNKIPSGYKSGQMQQFTPEQMQLFQQMFSNVGPDSFLSKLGMGDEQTFNQIEAPSMRQFSGLQGNIASRFSAGGQGPGALGSRKSSGFQNYMNQATSDFASDLQSRRQSLQQGAIKDLMGMSNQLLSQNPYENFMVKKQQKEGMDWLGLGGAAAGGVGGFFAGGPAGALAGAGMGYNMLGRNGKGTSNEDVMNFNNAFMK